ncbi:MAG: DUF4129 domain-containing protein, partial [Acidimicrobiia bacterium]|nr:DUF4129 domain-containing protein [Acidimicrobiia bacterium]
MALGNGGHVVYRYSWIAGLAALAFGLYRLNGLLRPNVDGAPWQLVVLAGVLLGTIITWTALTYQLRTWSVAAINLAALLVAAFRVAAPNEGFLFLPTLGSFSTFFEELAFASGVIRSSVSPVIPVPGLIVIVMALFWGLGAALSWGLLRDRPFVATMPALVVGLQLSTVDRQPTSNLLTLVFLTILAAVLLAVVLDRRDQRIGRMTRLGGASQRPSQVPARSAAVLGLTLVASLLLSGGLRDVVPYDGVLAWRSSTGLTGSFYGSVSYNPFIGIRRGLVANSGTTVFFAEIGGELDPSDVYFRLVTMESFDGTQFSARDPQIRPLEGDAAGESPASTFTGPTAAVTQRIRIEGLSQDWLPASYTPVGIESSDDRLLNNVSVRDDGSLVLDGGLTRRGMEYSVISEVPQPDLGVLSVDENGQPTAAFAAAVAAGREPILPTPGVVEVRPEPPDVEQYLNLPDDIHAGIEVLAREQTENLDTDYERGLALEAFLRGFNYSLEVPDGHAGDDLASWLLDDTAVGYYRTGYCEQFATSMAVMARTLDIPSRVVLGFTPGEPVFDDNDDAVPGVVRVRDRNAHAWVELWMPSQGWVRFDPTPRSDGINPSTFESLPYDITPFLDLPDPEPVLADTGGGLLPPFADDVEFPTFVGGSGGAEENQGFTIPTWLRWAVPVGIALATLFAFIPAMKWVRRRRRMRRLETGDISAAWTEIVERLTDLGVSPNPAFTPAEVAAHTDPAMVPLATVYGEALYGPPGRVDAQRIQTA